MVFNKTFAKLKNKSFSVSCIIDYVEQHIYCFVYEPSVWEQKIDRPAIIKIQMKRRL